MCHPSNPPARLWLSEFDQVQRGQWSSWELLQLAAYGQTAQVDVKKSQLLRRRKDDCLPQYFA